MLTLLPTTTRIYDNKIAPKVGKKLKDKVTKYSSCAFEVEAPIY
jgi:hypothetical protein